MNYVVHFEAKVSSFLVISKSDPSAEEMVRVWTDRFKEFVFLNATLTIIRLHASSKQDALLNMCNKAVLH